MKKAILLAAYGASEPKSKDGLRHFEHLCRQEFPGWPARWAFTSALARERMASQRRKSDSLAKALMRLRFEGFEAVCVQPLQVIPGKEHCEARATVRKIAQTTGLLCRVGAPLMAVPEDVGRLSRALAANFPRERAPGEDIVLMGHGARHSSVSLYAELAENIARMDPRAHVGAMSGSPALEDILPELSSRRVWLLPLLSLVGRHALRDMAGDEESSWKSRIEACGHICQPALKGLAECDAMARIWLANLREAASELERDGE